MRTITVCPVCRHNTFSDFLACKDYIVSHETFQLQRCDQCNFVLTNPQPDSHNLGKYYESPAYVSHAEQSQSLMDRVYHIARAFTLKWKYRLLLDHSLKRPNSILDVGAGTGAFLQQCKAKGMHIAGVEPAPAARTVARNITGAEIAEQPHDVTGTYDVITLWHVLEHVSDLHPAIEKLASLLVDTGTMFIAVPNHPAADAKKYAQHWAAFDVPRHLWHFTRSTMTSLLQQHNLNVAEILPMPLDAYYVCLLSEKYRTGRNGIPTMITAMREAYRSNRAARKSQEYSSLIYVVRK